MLHSSLQQNEHKTWKTVFGILSLITIVGMPLLSRDYGQSGDEWVQMEYGRDIWNYFFNGDNQALSYDNKSLQYSHLEYYGGLFDFSMHALHEWFPGINILTLRHFFNALLGAFIVMFTGLLARRLSNRWSIGLLALLFMLFSPRIFGESMNNPKDIPFAAGFVIGMYGIVALLQDFPRKAWRQAVLIAAGWGLAYGVRPAGGMLLGGYFVIFIALWYLFNKEFKEMIRSDKKQRNKFLLVFIVAVFAGYAVGMLTWPWGLQSPISNPFVALQGMTNREMSIRVLFEGVYRVSGELPSYYEFKWIFISNPLVVIIGSLLFVVLVSKGLKKYGKFAVILVVFSSLFPLLYMIYKHSTVYDTWRHVFFVYPFWVVAGAMGWGILEDYIKKEQMKMLPFIIAVVGLIPAMIWTVRSHPNQYIYFNELEGGPAGANGYYDLDYYQNSGREAAEWIKKNVKPIPGRKIIVLSNMSAIWRYFEDDTSWISANYGRYNERNSLEWDYYIATPRYISPYLLQNELWPPKSSVYTIAIDKAPLSAVLRRSCTEAHKALMNKDFATAAHLYDSCLKAGINDADLYFNYGIALASMGNMAGAVNALQKAKEQEPSNMEYLGVLAQVYQAQGDNQSASRIQSEMQAITMRENEFEE